MSSPFPGVDPYFEAHHWSSFHTCFNVALIDVLMNALPESYIAIVETDLYLVAPFDGPERSRVQPDVIVSGGQSADANAEQALMASAMGSTGTRYEVAFPNDDTLPHRYIEIQTTSDRQVVAMVETLSPTNKRPGSGRDQYLNKRNRVAHSEAHLIELDLLLGGPHLPPLDTLASEDDYFALVSATTERPRAEVIGWRLEEPCPMITVPLIGTDSVSLNLQDVVATAWSRGHFGRVIRYDRPLPDSFPASLRERIERLRTRTA